MRTATIIVVALVVCVLVVPAFDQMQQPYPRPAIDGK